MNRIVLNSTRRSGFVALMTLLALALSTPAQSTDLFKQAAHFRYGESNAALTALEGQIRSAKPEQQRSLEAELVKILQSSEATKDAKAWVCRALRRGLRSSRTGPGRSAE